MQYLIPAGAPVHKCRCGARVADVCDGKYTAQADYDDGELPCYGDVHICNVRREQLVSVKKDTAGLPQLNAAELAEVKRSLSRRMTHKIAGVRPLTYRFKPGRECEFCGDGCMFRIAMRCGELVYEFDVCGRHRWYNGMSSGC